MCTLFAGASLEPPWWLAGQVVLSCLPGASLRSPGVLGHPKWVSRASQAFHMSLSSLPGLFHGLSMTPGCFPGKQTPALPWNHPVSLASWHLPGCPNGLSMALGCLPGKQNQIWPWQITGVSWFCLGRLLESSGRGNLGRSPKP